MIFCFSEHEYQITRMYLLQCTFENYQLCGKQEDVVQSELSSIQYCIQNSNGRYLLNPVL